MIDSLTKKYGMDIPSLHVLNMQRLGVCTDLYPGAARIDVNFSHKGKEFHIPFGKNPESPYQIIDRKISCGDSGSSFPIISTREELPTSYYLRGGKVLTINTTFLSPCFQKCVFCEETIAPERRRYSVRLSTEELFDKVMDEQKLLSLDNLSQISVVTSCTGTEARAQELILGYKSEAEERGFRGKLLFATNEIRSEQALRILADAGNVILAFTVECYANRTQYMPGSKGKISLERIREILFFGKSLGIETTYFYILGLDNLQDMRRGFTLLKDAVNIAPTCPIYQSQGGVDNIGIRSLEYFLVAKKIYNETHRGVQQFESCQSFRSLNPLEIRSSRTLIA